MIMTTSAYRGIQVPSLRNIRAEATSEIELDGPYEVRRVERGQGVRCGNHGRVQRGHEVYHATGASVRACYELTAQMEADQAAEIAAERGYERFLEERGYHEARDEEDREFWAGVNHY